MPRNLDRMTPEEQDRWRKRQREYQRQYYLKNRERLLEYKRERYRTNPEYRARIRAASLRRSWLAREAEPARFPPMDLDALPWVAERQVDGRRQRIYALKTVAALLGMESITLGRWFRRRVLPRGRRRWEFDPAVRGRGIMAMFFTEDEVKVFLEHRHLLALPYRRIEGSPFVVAVNENWPGEKRWHGDASDGFAPGKL